jgi:hypothetical protein
VQRAQQGAARALFPILPDSLYFRKANSDFPAQKKIKTNHHPNVEEQVSRVTGADRAAESD